MGQKTEKKTEGEYTWGPKLFGVTFVLILVFFWWLVLSSHGITPIKE